VRAGFAVVARVRLAVVLLFASCANANTSSPTGGDLPLGDFTDDKADGDWGHALECKPVPDLPSLVSPTITLSIDGLTLHLVDPASGYDRVFPVGPGAIDATDTDPEFGESLSYRPIIDTGTHDFAITPSTIQTCKTWWTDPETGDQIPVFAGLPFLSWHGNYAIHGPIDNYTAANGGTLRRGFVSHGCFRMEAADILEVYARIKDVAKTPVHVQREPERRTDGTIVDVAPKWIGASCEQDGDCATGYCAQNRYTGRGFCSAHCTLYCDDKVGYPSTFCVDDPSTGNGMCVPKMVAQDQDCRPFEQMTAHTASRHGQPQTTASVCLPGSPGWVGDRCFADADCGNGTTCQRGLCSMPCDQFCSDEPGSPSTFCAADGQCARRCTAASNASECTNGTVCEATTRHGNPGVTRDICVEQ